MCDNIDDIYVTKAEVGGVFSIEVALIIEGTCALEKVIKKKVLIASIKDFA